VGHGHGAYGMIDSAVRLRLKHLTGDVDRYGNARFYVRISGRPKGVPGSEEFMAAYAVAIEGKPKALPRVAVRGSFRHLCQLYFASYAGDWVTRSIRRRGELTSR
jgi:hypothetical protein